MSTNSSISVGFSERLLSLRKEKGLSLREAAQCCGFTASFLGYLESGARKPSRETLDALARYYGVSRDWLEFGPQALIDSALKDLEAEIEKSGLREAEDELLASLRAIIGNLKSVDRKAAEALVGHAKRLIDEFAERCARSNAGIHQAQLAIARLERQVSLDNLPSEAEAGSVSSSLVADLRERVKRLLPESSTQADLAKMLDISRQAIGAFLAGDICLSAENTLRLLAWAERVERQQKSSGTVGAAPEQAAQTKKSDHEKPSSGQRKK